MPLLAAADTPPDLRLCKPKFPGAVVTSDMEPFKIYLVLLYELPFVFATFFVIRNI